MGRTSQQLIILFGKMHKIKQLLLLLKIWYNCPVMAISIVPLDRSGITQSSVRFWD
jgi:hypothetical protein